MNQKQAQNLLPGTVIMRNGDPDQRGTVRDVVYVGIYINWEDGYPEFVAFNRAQHVSEWQPREATP